MKKLILTLMWSFFVCCSATAQQDKPATSETSPAANSVLQRFVGKWNTVSRAVTPDSIAPTDYKGTLESQMMGKTWLINEYDAVIGGVPFHALQRLGFDTRKQKYVGTWADSFMTHEWKLEGEATDDRLVINSKGPNPAKPGETANFRDVYEFKSENLIAGESQVQDKDETWTTFMTSEFHRTSAPAKPNSTARMLPMLMFDGQAEEAMKFYTSLFSDAAIENVQKYGAGENGKEGSVKLATFTVTGQRVMCIDSPAKHDFTFTPSFSLFVECESEAQLDDVFSKLSKDGKVMMTPKNYGFSKKFGWASDRFGVSWQLNLTSN